MEYWKRNLYIVWLSQFTAMIGMSAVIPFLPLFVRELGITKFEETANWSGWIFAAPFFISFFLAPVWGNMGDKYGRKIMTIRALFGLAVAQLIIGYSQNIYHLFAGRLLQGALSGFLPAAMALIASNTPEEKTGYALGVLQSSTAAGNVLGPSLGGILSDLIGFRNVFFVVSGILVIPAILLAFFVKEEVKISKTIPLSPLENWKLFIKNKVLLTTAIMITLTSLGFSYVRPIFVLYVETLIKDAKTLPTITGILFSIMGIFSTISSAWWGRKVETRGIKFNLMIASILTGSMYLSQYFINDLSLLYPVMMVLGFGFGALLPFMFTTISKNVSVERRGGVLGVASSFQILGHMAGPIAGGYSAGYFGFPVSFLITSCIFFSITLMTYYKINE